MMPHHNNQLNMIGLESDDECHSYPTPNSNKRKRDSVYDMMPEDNPFAGRDHVREEDIDPFDESHGPVPSDVNPFTNQSLVDGQEPNPFAGHVPNPFAAHEYPSAGHSESTVQYDLPFGTWAMDPFAEAHGTFASDWNLNSYRNEHTTFGNLAPSAEVIGEDKSSTTAMYQYQPILDTDTFEDGADRGPMPPTGSTETTSNVAEAQIKTEENEEDAEVSFTPFGEDESDESDYEDRRPAKVPKLNKDGVPRKPRQPRPKLLKWQDDDWKRVCLGIVWACGDNGIQIPFEQASQVVSESCTAGALQQALLKLRAKQIAEGHQIPALKMAWTRKGRNPAPPKTDANTNTSQGTLRKKPTRATSGQTRIVRLRRPYREADRLHLTHPYIIAEKNNVGPLRGAPGVSDMASPTTAFPSDSNTVNDVPAEGEAPPMSRRLSQWKHPSDWTHNIPENKIGPTPGMRNSLYLMSRANAANNNQLRPDTTPMPSTSGQDQDPGCLDGMVHMACDAGKKSKAASVRKLKKARGKLDTVPAFFKDHFGKKDDRLPPGGASGGGIST